MKKPTICILLNFLIRLLPLVCSFSICNNQRHQNHRPSSFFHVRESNTPQDRHYVHRHHNMQTLGRRPTTRTTATTITPLLASNNDEDDFVGADDLPAVQGLFSRYCDKDGLMNKEKLIKMPPFSEMLEDDDLKLDELQDIWDAAPKFPEVGENENSRIDVDGFVQIYRDVDDLFDDEDDYEEESDESKAEASNDDNGDDENDDDDLDGDDQDETFEAELERVFSNICDKDGLMSKETLKEWEEIVKLMEEGLVGEDEIDELWEKTPKSPGTNKQLDVEGFLSFNVALDGLFEFEDEDDDVEIGDDIAADNTKEAKPVVEGDDLPPGVLFAAIADEDYLVGMDELKRWGELQDMIEDGDLLPSELQTIYDGIESTESGKLDEDGFTKLFEAVDALFEGDDEDEAEEAGESVDSRVKDDLLSFIDYFVDDEELLPCGLEASDKDRKQVLSIVTALESQPSNLIRQRNGEIDLKDLVGTWELLYSSSSAMKFNEGLTGVGGSFPNGKFSGLKQKFETTKFVNDMEYIERVEVNPSSASFDVSVTGSWDLRTSVSLFTGLPTIVVAVEPDRVNYGPTSTRADHWKSLGPMNLLDLTYLDDDLRVMRGCTSADTIFILKRVP